MRLRREGLRVSREACGWIGRTVGGGKPGDGGGECWGKERWGGWVSSCVRIHLEHFGRNVVVGDARLVQFGDSDGHTVKDLQQSVIIKMSMPDNCWYPDARSMCKPLNT